MKVISWNIAGCHKFKGRTESASDYSEQDFDYFVQILENAQADFVGLQESFTSAKDGVSQAEQFASKVNYQYCENHPYGESHYDHGNRLSLGNLSKLPVTKNYFYLLPNPKISILRPNGQTWTSFDVGFLVSVIDCHGQKINIANSHLVPL